MLYSTLGKKLLSSKNITKDSFVWNSIASYLNSFQTMVLLLFITHFGSPSDGSFFVMGYAIANLLLNVGRYGTRQFQVTDVKEKYSYRDYVYSRQFAMFLFSIGLIAYLAWGIICNGYSFSKVVIITFICIHRGIEAIEDVMHGRMQQMGRLDVASKILTIRLGIFIAGFAICFCITRDLILTTILNVAITAILCLILNKAVISYLNHQDEKNTKAGFPKGLLLECLPIALTTILGMYLCNAPKYIIDGIVSDEMQTNFNIVFMPVFVVALFSNFIFNPYLRKMGELWSSGQTSNLRALVFKLTLAPIAIDILVTLCGYFWGLPILSFVYGVNLSGYLGELVLFLVLSGIISILNLYGMVLTTIRKQMHILYGYIAGAVIMLIIGRPVLLQTDLFTLSLVFLGIETLVAIYIMLVTFVFIRKTQKED